MITSSTSVASVIVLLEVTESVMTIHHAVLPFVAATDIMVSIGINGTNVIATLDNIVIMDTHFIVVIIVVVGKWVGAKLCTLGVCAVNFNFTAIITCEAGWY